MPKTPVMTWGEFRKSVRDFQGEHDLPIDGEPGPETWGAAMDDIATAEDQTAVTARTLVKCQEAHDDVLLDYMTARSQLAKERNQPCPPCDIVGPGVAGAAIGIFLGTLIATMLF